MIHHTLRRTARAAAPALILAVLAPLVACEDEAYGNGPNNEPAINEIVLNGPIDASSATELTHFNLATGAVVASTADWDVAFRRFEVRLNGGVSGAKGVTGYGMDNNAGSTDPEILAFTVGNTEAAFDAVREAQIPEDEEFVADRLVANAYGYLNLGGAPTANAGAYWKVRTAAGGFALVRVSAITLDQQFALSSITVESRLEIGGVLGAPQTFTASPAGSPVSIALATNGTVTPSGCNWDLQVDPQSFQMTVNSACNAGTFPCPSAPTFPNVTAAGDAPEYAAYLAGLTGPVPNSFTSPSAPFRYNLEGTNRLHPTFNIYLVKTGTRVYKLQVVNYYGSGGESAHPTIRYARIR